jgi:hypothetical protein
MKQSLALLLLSCVLVAQDKPAVESPKPAAVKTAAESKPKIAPINIRDELIELIHQLKKEGAKTPESPLRSGTTNQALANILAAEYEADMKAKTETQRLLLLALVELAKLPVDVDVHTHSSDPAARPVRRKRQPGDPINLNE